MERKWTLEDAYVHPKYIFCILWHVDDVYVEISMNPNDQYRLWTFVFLIRLTEQSVNHHLRKFNIPQKNTNEPGPAWHIAGNHRIREQKKIAFSHSDPGGTLENKLNNLKLLFSCKKSLTFQKRPKKMFLHWRANLSDQNKLAGERRFSKSGGFSASVSFLPRFLPPLSFFGSCFISRAAKTENPVPRSFFAPKPNGNACVS